MNKKKLKETFVSGKLLPLYTKIKVLENEIISEMLYIASDKSIIIPDHLKDYVKTTSTILLKSKKHTLPKSLQEPFETNFSIPIPFEEKHLICEVDENEQILKMLSSLNKIKEMVVSYEKMFYSLLSSYTEYQLYVALPELLPDISEISKDEIDVIRLAYEEVVNVIEKEIIDLADLITEEEEEVCVSLE